MIIRQIKTAPMDVFCYILSCKRTSHAIMIDPGGREELLATQLKAEELLLDYIVNTHNHPDHTYGNRKIQEETGAKIVMHMADQGLIDSQEIADIYRRIDFPVSDTPPPDLLVKDNQQIKFGDCAVTVIHTPGHSPGSICLFGEGNLFTGDSLFVGGAGRVDLPGADFNILLASLEKKIAPLPSETTIWPGHDYGDSPRSTLGYEKQTNPYIGGTW